ncbi:FkbM family methyltransferase [Vibrio alfacsensis]|uniref:FkbM family methyltransferase n=1 Tax=Vibrio alfacsensis TaxID=1074311 RepID=UPI002ADD53FB|nr:FkbM family methyltransferase [Vibrio alfacsensis]WQE76410.1 FkbM family methyltransferase [Vibrio alfacsensis]
MNKYEVKLRCLFTPSKEKRKRIREKYRKQKGQYKGVDIPNGMSRDMLEAFDFHNIEIVRNDVRNGELFLRKNNLNLVSTSQYCYILKEVFCDFVYFINPKYLSKDRYSVIDFGMNRGYASLYFAEQDWCHNVISVEMVPKTFNFAQKNFRMNPNLAKKITTFNCGLSDTTGQIEIYSLPHRDGISSMSLEFLSKYAPEEVTNKTYHTEVCTIKKASDFAKEILPLTQSNIILKVDVEGAEYAILNNLIDDTPEFFANIDIIIGELHLGMKDINERMTTLGYELVETKQNGQVCDVLFVKKKLL